MYSPKVCSARVDSLVSEMRKLTGVTPAVRPRTPAEVEGWVHRLSDVKGKPTKEHPTGPDLRELTPEEQEFVTSELILTKCDYRYWAERYSYCSTQGAGIKRMYPLFNSQKLVLEEFGRIEEASFDTESGGGIMANVLKARRLGASTLTQSMDLHRFTTQAYLYGVVASDVPDQSSFTIAMLKLAYDKLPWYLKPSLKFFSNTYPEYYEFDNGSQVWAHSGESNRGTEGNRGNIGRGKGVSVCHLTELATWEDATQIDSALLPTMTPPHARVLAVFESSPQGRNSWWFEHWQASMKGEGYFTPIFLPWYGEPKKYRLAAPVDWKPLQSTLTHARRCEEQGPRWLHRTVSLTRDQLYWYERNRAYYEGKRDLNTFLSEYAADPDECFTFSGKSLIPPEVIQKIVDQSRPVRGVFEIAPLMDLESQRARGQGGGADA